MSTKRFRFLNVATLPRSRSRFFAYVAATPVKKKKRAALIPPVFFIEANTPLRTASQMRGTEPIQWGFTTAKSLRRIEPRGLE
ncbi:MAG: hypothetical protein BWY50_01771 [Spirochaetes bacterium ADurb.Bin315]|nr:MAG: hypothetical protein BWY50_01771 [Spirochaetes bacterium ADurb.Bin315]